MFNECVNECQTSQITTKIVGSQIVKRKGEEGARWAETVLSALIFIMSEGMSDL